MCSLDSLDISVGVCLGVCLGESVRLTGYQFFLVGWRLVVRLTPVNESILGIEKRKYYWSDASFKKRKRRRRQGRRNEQSTVTIMENECAVHMSHDLYLRVVVLFLTELVDCSCISFICSFELFENFLYIFYIFQSNFLFF